MGLRIMVWCRIMEVIMRSCMLSLVPSSSSTRGPQRKAGRSGPRGPQGARLGVLVRPGPRRRRGAVPGRLPRPPFAAGPPRGYRAAGSHRGVQAVFVLGHGANVAGPAGAAILRGSFRIVAHAQQADVDHVHELVDERRFLAAVAFGPHGQAAVNLAAQAGYQLRVLTNPVGEGLGQRAAVAEVDRAREQ